MLSDWVLVVDKDEYSSKQKSICSSLKPDLRGMIDCNDIDNTHTPLCNNVTHFPAFCHIPTNSCVYGIRESLNSINTLTALLKTKDQENNSS